MANVVAVLYPMFLSAFRQVYCHEIYHYLRNHRQVLPPLSSRRGRASNTSQAAISCQPASCDKQTAEDTVLAEAVDKVPCSSMQ